MPDYARRSETLLADEPTKVPLNGNGGRILLAMVWPVSLLALGIFLAVAAVIVTAFLTAPDVAIADIAQVIAKGGAFRQMVALLIIIPAIVSLSMAGKVEGAAAIAAISAIAGYVLGSQVSQ